MRKDQKQRQGPPTSVTDILARVKRPKKAVITAGMPYANGSIHLGHLAGAHIPPDIFARYMRMLIGKDNVLFVCGSDDHGSNSEVSAKKEGTPIKEFIEKVRKGQKKTFDRYGISFDIYTGTSKEDNFEGHKELCQEFLRKLHKNKMLEKKTSEQWFDSKVNMFLPDRFVYGTCPSCGDQKAYSDECDACGATYEPKELKDPKSTVSDDSPVLKETDHWWLNMWRVSDQLKEWIESKQKTWRKNVFSEVHGRIIPSLIFSNKDEEKFKSLKEVLPRHKSRYAPGKKIVVLFDSLSDLKKGEEIFGKEGIESEKDDGWAHRSITRDVSWGIPVPSDLDPEMDGKTFYVWPESLVAPIAFTKTALKEKGLDPELYKEYWCDPDAKVYQFLGQDNVFFYVLMQGAMWFGTQEDPFRMPNSNELQLTDVFSCFHLQIEGEKMSKSRGNFYTGDELIDDKGYTVDQIRYFLSILSLTEKTSNFDFENFKSRNEFLAGPLNAAFEKPISACLKRFEGIVPAGTLIGKTEKETLKIAGNYFRMMEKAEYAKLLFQIENYARIINSLFAQFKPHDDRHDETERANALYSCFYILKNLMIMLYPFVPETMDRLRVSLNLPESVFNVEELGNGIEGGHKIGELDTYFPSVGK